MAPPASGIGFQHERAFSGPALLSKTTDFGKTPQARSPPDASCWPNELACRRQVFKWLTRYNTKRRHSWCRYQPPIAYETSYTARLPTAA